MIEWILAGTGIGVLLYGVYKYNQLIRLRNMVDEAWSSVDVQLKRRYNLIPNLVATVKGYMKHERETLEKVVQARMKAIEADSPDKKAEAEGVLTSMLGRIFALAEAYPELKANVNFLKLQDELSKVEEAIQNARRYYNAVVRDYNNAVEMFPGNIIARMFGFEKRPYFEIPEKEKENVQVSF